MKPRIHQLNNTVNKNNVTDLGLWLGHLHPQPTSLTPATTTLMGSPSSWTQIFRQRFNVIIGKNSKRNDFMLCRSGTGNVGHWVFRLVVFEKVRRKFVRWVLHSIFTATESEVHRWFIVSVSMFPDTCKKQIRWDLGLKNNKKTVLVKGWVRFFIYIYICILLNMSGTALHIDLHKVLIFNGAAISCFRRDNTS